MKTIDFLDAVGKVDPTYIEECLTYRPPQRRNLFLQRVGAIAACFLLVMGIIQLIRWQQQPVVTEENGFRIEDGVLIRYSGTETDITVPDTVETIADFAFLSNENAGKIETVRIGTNVQTIEINAFAGLDNLLNLIIAENNLSFVEKDGLLLSSDGSILFRYEREEENSFTVPDSVRFIAAHAVQNTQLEEIDFGKNLEYIGYNAFAGNHQLKAIYLPETLKYISTGAFASCTSAVDGSVPENAELGDGAFESVPFYLSLLAGQMSPLEEVRRERISPSEAILQSNLDALTAQIAYILATLRGEEYEADEAAMFAYGAVCDHPAVPDGMTIPETFTLDDLTFTDTGWGKTGIYDVQIQMSAGDYTLVMEAYGYETYTALYWKDVRFRIARLYYVQNPENINPDDTVTAFGWTAVFSRDGELYNGITYTHEDGTRIHSFLPAESDVPYTLTFSPEGTRVAVEYSRSGTACFYVQSLNGDVLMEPNYDYNQYLNQYYGSYKAASLKWIDEDILEGENANGKFRWNIYEFSVTQPEDEMRTEDSVYFASAEECMNWLFETGEANAFPSSPYIITISGFHSPVILEMKGYANPVSITAYGQTLTITEDAELYGNYTFDLFEADGAIVFQWGYYHIDYTYILSETFTQTLVPGKDDTVHLYLDESGNLRYMRINNRIADIVQTGGLCAAKGYDDFLYSSGLASITNGALVLGDAEESCTIGEKYDLDTEFIERGYSREYESIEAVFADNRAYANAARETTTRLLSMTVSELRSAYGALTLDYSENGPMQPVYSVKNLYGVYLVFHNWNMDDPLPDDMIPDEIIIAGEEEYTVLGFTLLRDISEFSNILRDNPTTVSCSIINGTVQTQTEMHGTYSVECLISGHNTGIPDETTAATFDYETWAAEYLRNPTGIILQIRLSPLS